MAELTDAQRRRVDEPLRRLSSAELEWELRSAQSFGDFLRRHAYDIWVAVSGFLRSIWNSLRGWFGWFG
ncbi:hypothetical protein ACWGB8_31900 [Kitasatospora sp. NPDC054939]